MTTWLPALAHATNGRPFTPEEVNRVVGYAESLPARLAAVKGLEDGQRWVVRRLAEHVAPKAAEWGLPKDPFTTDFALFLTAVGHAVLADDLDALDETTVGPCLELAAALDLPADELAALFDVAWDALAGRLDGRSAGLLRPAFERVADRLRAAGVAPRFPAMIEV